MAGSQGLNEEAYCCVSDSIESVLPIADILYVTRVQRERRQRAFGASTEAGGPPGEAGGAPCLLGGASEGPPGTGGPPPPPSEGPSQSPIISGFCVTAKLLHQCAKPSLKV